MPEKVLTKEEILSVLRKNKSFFKKKYDIDNIILFGSFARGDATDESDVDILLESTSKSFDALFRIKELLEKELDRKVDLAYRDAVRTFVLEFIEKDFIYA